MNLMRKFILLTGLAVLVPTLAQAQMSEGTIKVFSARGTVNLVNTETGATKPLERGMEFSDGMQVVTGEKSSALLLFSNGAAVTVSENSTFEVSEFVQAEFDPSQGTFMRLTEDPSQSKTELYLDGGTVAGQVKRLQEGSTYNVNTPTASAGIRGTDYVVTVTQSGDQVFTTITNASGDVVAIVEGNPTNIAPGESVTVSGSVSTTPQGTKVVTVTNVGTPRPATAEETQTAQDAVDEIQEAQTETDQIVLPPAPTEPTENEGETPDEPIDPGIDISPAGG